MESTFNNPPHVNNPSTGSSTGTSKAGSTSSSSPKRNTGASSNFSSSTSESFGNESDTLVNKVKNIDPQELMNKVKNIDYQEQMQMIREKAGVAYDSSADVIKQNPVVYVAGAAVVGFFAGMLFSRK